MTICSCASLKHFLIIHNVCSFVLSSYRFVHIVHTKWVFHRTWKRSNSFIGVMISKVQNINRSEPLEITNSLLITYYLKNICLNFRSNNHHTLNLAHIIDFHVCNFPFVTIATKWIQMQSFSRYVKYKFNCCLFLLNTYFRWLTKANIKCHIAYL